MHTSTHESIHSKDWFSVLIGPHRQNNDLISILNKRQEYTNYDDQNHFNNYELVIARGPQCLEQFGVVINNYDDHYFQGLKEDAGWSEKHINKLRQYTKNKALIGFKQVKNDPKKGWGYRARLIDCGRVGKIHGAPVLKSDATSVQAKEASFMATKSDAKSFIQLLIGSKGKSIATSIKWRRLHSGQQTFAVNELVLIPTYDGKYKWAPRWVFGIVTACDKETVEVAYSLSHNKDGTMYSLQDYEAHRVGKLPGAPRMITQP